MAVDGSVAVHSVAALLRRADELAHLDCASPGENVAVLEHLLAICFAAGVCPTSDEQWRSWVIEKHSLAQAAEWLLDQPGRSWDMFDPDQPLLQNSNLAQDLQESGTGPAQLILEQAGDYSLHFDHHHLEADVPLPMADAYRAVLTQHVYSTYGRARMSGARLGARVTNLAAGRLTGRIRVVALGATLAETIRLNLYPPDGPPDSFNTSWTMAGVQRRDFYGIPKARSPRSSADLHSALGRSVLLRPAIGPNREVVVDKVLIGAGEILELDQERHLQDAVFTTTTGEARKPMWPSPTRALWQDAHALYGAVKDGQAGLYARMRSLPYARHGMQVPYTLWAVGLLTKQALPAGWTHGAYPYAPGMEAHLYHASKRGSDIAEYLATSLKKAAIVAAELAFPAMRASDEAGQVARLDARESFWPSAEPPFDEMLDDVIDRGPGDADPTSEPLDAYAEELHRTARTQMIQRLDALPPSDRNHRARAAAIRRFDDDMSEERAPAELRRRTARD